MKYKFSIDKSRGDGLFFKKIKLPAEISPVEAMLYDMEGFSEAIFFEIINDVLSGKVAYAQFGGNIVDLQIRGDYTKVYDLFAGEGVLEECTIETEELQKIIRLWVSINKELLNNNE